MISFKEFFFEYVKPTRNSFFRRDSALYKRTGAPESRDGEVKNGSVNIMPDYMKKGTPNYKSEIPAGIYDKSGVMKLLTNYPHMNIDNIDGTPKRFGNLKSKSGKAINIKMLSNGKYQITHD